MLDDAKWQRDAKCDLVPCSVNLVNGESYSPSTTECLRRYGEHLARLRRTGRLD
jgi:hypothetical protein